MRPSKDAIGEAMKSFLDGRRAYEIIERDDGNFDVSSGPMAYFYEYHEWPEHEREAISRAKGRVLDIGAGAGRGALHLQDMGMDVTSIDNSPLAIEVCIARGVQKVILMPLEKIRLLKEKFDTVVMFCNNFGLFGNRDSARKLLKTLHDLTSEHAVILAASMDPHNSKDEADLRYRKRNMRRGRMPGQNRVRVRYSIHKTGWFDYMLVSPDEMAMILHGTGWQQNEILRSEGSTYVAVLNKVATL
jgi:SAM-dependent methyltransferase